MKKVLSFLTAAIVAATLTLAPVADARPGGGSRSVSRSSAPRSAPRATPAPKPAAPRPSTPAPAPQFKRVPASSVPATKPGSSNGFSSAPPATAPKVGSGFTSTPPAAAAPTPSSLTNSSGFTSQAPTNATSATTSPGFTNQAPSVAGSTPSSGSNGFTSAAPGTAKPVTASGTTPSSPIGSSQLGSATARQNAKAALTSYRSQYAKPAIPPSNPAKVETATRSLSSRGISNIGDYQRSRDTYWQQRNYAPQPYAYQGSSSFGMWDAMFLWMMLDSLDNRDSVKFYQSHKDDPDVQKWRAEAEAEAKENEELKAKLAKLDAESGKLAASGEKVDPDFIPAGAEAAAIATTVAEEKLAAAPVDPQNVRWVNNVAAEQLEQSGTSLATKIAIGMTVIMVSAVAFYLVLGKRMIG